MHNVLSIQSAVAYGHAGNSSATFPLQRAGVNVYPVYTVTFSNKTDAEGSFPNLVLRPQSPAGLRFERINGDGPWWFNRDSDALTPSADGTVQVPLNSPLSSNSSETFTFTADYAIDTAAMTDNDWKALGACDPKDPSKGVTTQIDVDGNGAGFEAGSFTTCTPVTRPQG